MNLEESCSLFKVCRTCKEEKPHTDYYVDKRYNSLSSECKRCRCKTTGAYQRANPEKVDAWQQKYRAKNAERIRERSRQYLKEEPEKRRALNKKRNRNRLLKLLKITEDDLSAALLAQGNVCAICRSELRPGRHTHIDHSHKSGKFRGFLCLKCNTGLGKFNDSPRLLRRAAFYLDRKQ